MKYFVGLLLVLLLLQSAVVLFFNLASPEARATALMAWGLIIIWIFICGGVMYKGRDRIKQMVQKLPGRWQIKFIAFATALALLEEAITTFMTNFAPVFGVAKGQAAITASTNYLDVIFFHSVFLFVGMFVAWALILSRYSVSPNKVFILFGISGVFAEMSFGTGHIFEFALWMFVYGLMVYLPAYCVPERPGLKAVRLWHYPIFIFLPFLFIIPAGLIISIIDPGHPVIHF